MRRPARGARGPLWRHRGARRARSLDAVRLRWIEARDFRNHEHTELEVPEGLVVAVGGNGEGKTKLLEAAYYLLALSSPRASSDQPLGRRGAAGGTVWLRGGGGG